MLADSQGLLMEGLRHLLIAHGFDVVDTADDGMEALAKTRAHHPDVVLVDIQLPHSNGFEAARLINAEMPHIKVVMLGLTANDDDLFEAVKSGASGYLLKQSNASEFLRSLADLSAGEPALSRGLTARILTEYARLARAAGDGAWSEEKETTELTPRQIGVLSLVAQGLSYREVADALCLTEHSIKYHMREIKARLHIENRAQVIALAQRAGLIPSGRPRAD